jgi:hypothetical protein
MGPAGMAEAEDEVTGAEIMVTREDEAPFSARLLGDGRFLAPQGQAKFSSGEELEVEGSTFEVDSTVTIADGSVVVFLAATEE